MLGIPRRYSHFVYGAIQSGITSLLAAAITSYPFLATGQFLRHCLLSWLISWAALLPVVLVAAPVLKSMSMRLTRE